jgi:hypothetical protein
MAVLDKDTINLQNQNIIVGLQKQIAIKDSIIAKLKKEGNSYVLTIDGLR